MQGKCQRHPDNKKEKVVIKGTERWMVPDRGRRMARRRRERERLRKLWKELDIEIETDKQKQKHRETKTSVKMKASSSLIKVRLVWGISPKVEKGEIHSFNTILK